MGLASPAASPGLGRAQISLPVLGELLVNSRKRPSFDQLVGVPGCSVSSRSSPDPSAGLMYNLLSSLRFEEKTTFFPSGDHTGLSSLAGLKVKRVEEFRAMSRIQMSRDPAAPAATATRLPSGERAGFAYSPGSLSGPAGLPFWSNQLVTSFDPAPAR